MIRRDLVRIVKCRVPLETALTLYTTYNFLAVDKLNWSDKKKFRIHFKNFDHFIYLHDVRLVKYIKITSLIT